MIKPMLSSIHTLYLVCLKHKVPLYSNSKERQEYLKTKKDLSMAVSDSAFCVADFRNMSFGDMNEIVLATNFFIEKWKNYD